MPYKLKKFGSGYKVCKKYGKQKCFSKKPLSKERAKAQMRAIIANESLSFEDYYFLTENATTVDKIQAALDVAGFEPTIGTAADATNTVISGLRAALSKESDERKKHIINAGISAVSMIPFADVIKILKLRKFKPLARLAIKGAKNLKNTAQTIKMSDRFTTQKNSELNEKLEFTKGGFHMKADDPEKGITLAQIFKDVKDNRVEIVKRIKQSIKSYHFSPLVVAASLVLAGINTQNFINQNPEVLNYGINQNVIDKAANFLDKNPKILKFFQ
jgi:hypothetical protein